MVHSFAAKGGGGGAEGRVGGGRGERKRESEFGNRPGLVLVGFMPGNTDTLSVFVSLCVSILEQLGESRKLAKRVSVWPQRWTLLVTGPAAHRE